MRRHETCGPHIGKYLAYRILQMYLTNHPHIFKLRPQSRWSHLSQRLTPLLPRGLSLSFLLLSTVSLSAHPPHSYFHISINLSQRCDHCVQSNYINDFHWRTLFNDVDVPCFCEIRFQSVHKLSSDLHHAPI